MAMIYRYQDGVCRFSLGHGLSPAYEALERAAVIPPGTGTIVGRALLERKAVCLADAWTDSGYTLAANARTGSVRSMLAVPLLRGDEIIGVIGLGRAAVQSFTQQQIDRVTTLGDQVAVAIESARLFEEQQKAQHQAEQQRALMAEILASLSDGLALCEPDGTTSIHNDAIYEINGWPRHNPDAFLNFRDSIMWQLQNGHIPRIADKIEDDADRLAATFIAGSPFRPIIQRPNGRWVEVQWKILSGDRRLIIHRDVTDLKAASEALREQQERLAAILDHLPDGVALFAANGDILHLNPAIYKINRLPRELDIRNLNFTDILRWKFNIDHLKHEHDNIEDFIKAQIILFCSGESFQQQYLRYGRWVDVLWLPLANGRRLIIHRDITLLKEQELKLQEQRDAAEQARAEAEAANQAKSTFLATMSHEIRTPMNGVLGMMDVLEHATTNPSQREAVALMRESAASLLHIIDEVLDFSKIEAGYMELEEIPFSLSELVSGAVRAIRPLAVKKNLQLVMAIDPRSADILLGDPTRVRQILYNLLGNAVKFTEQGSVHVRASTEPLGEGHHTIILTVTDTGIGMDTEQQARLFQPFAQGDSSTTRRFGGTGLGLSIVHRLMNLMDGAIKVDSSPGQGTTFTVMLRLRSAPEERHIIRPPTATTALTVISGTLLVVDDHPINREVLVRQLGLLGLKADTATDGYAALECWQPNRYVAVLADIHMPGMDGYRLTQEIRAREQKAGAARTPIVAVTANAMRGEKERCLNGGMDAYIAKPVDLRLLRETLLPWVEAAQPELPVPKPIRSGIDLAVLREWVGNNPPEITALLRRFLDSARESVAIIQTAINHGDLAAIQSAAHRLKGAALTVGAAALADLATAMEQSAFAGQHDNCAQALTALEAEMRLVAASI